MQIVYLPAGKAIDQQTKNGLARLIVQLDKHIHASCAKSKFSQYRLDSDAVLLSRAMNSLTSFNGGPRFDCAAATEYGKIVACLGYAVSDNSMGYCTPEIICDIGTAVTDEQYRGRGVMATLIDDVLARVRRDYRATYADLWVSAFNPSAERCWRQLGFDMVLDKYATVGTRSVPNTPPCTISKCHDCKEILHAYALNLPLAGTSYIDGWVRRSCRVYRCTMPDGDTFQVVCLHLPTSHVCYIEFIAGDRDPDESELASIIRAVNQVTRKDIVMLHVNYRDSSYGTTWDELPWIELSDTHLAKRL